MTYKLLVGIELKVDLRVYGFVLWENQNCPDAIATITGNGVDRAELVLACVQGGTRKSHSKFVFGVAAC